MDPVFVYVEGRELSTPYITNCMKRAATAQGWGFREFKKLEYSDLYDDEKMKKYFPEKSCAILRQLPHNTNIETMLVGEWLTAHGRVGVNFHGVGGEGPSNDKQYQQMILLGDPRTRDNVCMAYSVSSADDVLKLIRKGKLSYPLLLKPRNGSVGKGIMAIFNKDELMANEKWKLMAAQQFIDSYYDWRVYVVGGVAIGAVRRGGKENELKYDFRAQAKGIDIAGEKDQVVFEQIQRVACNATAVTGLEYGGVDIISDKYTGKYYVLEVNTSSTWGGYYLDAMGVSVAEEIVKWMDEKSNFSNRKKSDLIRSYIKKRLKNLPVKVQKRYQAILDGNESSRVGAGKDLTSRLHRCYDRLFTKGDNLIEAKCLIDEVEGMPLCWAGNFIGSATWGKDGVLEDGCIPSAYYLAIREKYDKMSKVN